VVSTIPSELGRPLYLLSFPFVGSPLFWADFESPACIDCRFVDLLVLGFCATPLAEAHWKRRGGEECLRSGGWSRMPRKRKFRFHGQDSTRSGRSHPHTLCRRHLFLNPNPLSQSSITSQHARPVLTSSVPLAYFAQFFTLLPLPRPLISPDDPHFDVRNNVSVRISHRIQCGDGHV
jgi:hypothetical protein